MPMVSGRLWKLYAVVTHNSVLMKRTLSILIFLLFCNALFSQDSGYARLLVDTLASDYLAGRGYTEDGGLKAANLIATEFQKHKLKHFGKDYFQKFRFPMNTFPGKMMLQADDVNLEAGTDFIINSNSMSVTGTFDLVYLTDTNMTWDKLQQKARVPEFRNKIFVVSKYFEALHGMTLPNIKGVLVLSDKALTWSVSAGFEVTDFLVIQCRKDKFPGYANRIQVDIENEFVKKYQALNVIGYLEGAVQPDSFIVFTAHYDHLGKLGTKATFNGANDNASGTAMIIDLARHYGHALNLPDYSIVFIAFAGEEAGLLGSSYFVENPLFPLKNIRFVINLDMVGTGIDGIKVVNGSIFKREFGILTEINAKQSLIKEVSMRGESKNSDHYPFYAAGIPAFFIYSLDPSYKDYHNVYDRPEHLPMTAYEGIFRLMTGFVNSFSKN